MMSDIARSFQFKSDTNSPGTCMFLIAHGPQHWQAGKVPTGKYRRERQIREVKSRSLRRHGGMNTTQGSKVASSIFIGRWTPKVLFSLEERPYRHGQLRRRLGSVSQRMLTRTLRNLESAGLIARRVTQSRAIAVEYSLTQLGSTIIAPLGGMCRWAKRYRRNVSAEVRLRESETG
jgi:DNA-binding HxlR family transcriptional regulator